MSKSQAIVAGALTALAIAGVTTDVIGEWVGLALLCVAAVVAVGPKVVDQVTLGWLSLDLEDDDEGGCP